MTANEPMPDERLAYLEVYEPVGGHTGLSHEEVADLLAEVKRARAAETRLQSDNGALIESGRKWMLAANADHDRAVAAEAELAELRATLRPEYGLRYPSNSTGEPDEQLGSASDEETARLLAAHGDTIMRRLRTDWEEAADDGQ